MSLAARINGLVSSINEIQGKITEQMKPGEDQTLAHSYHRSLSDVKGQIQDLQKYVLYNGDMKI